ncbi:MAG: Maf family protein [Candidatus Hodarchaeales archaeon]
MFRLTKELVLASRSPARRQLLENVGLKFIVDPSNIPESLDANTLEEGLVRLAKKKALSVQSRHADKIIIGTDTVVLFREKVLGKPKNRDEAFTMLSTLSGHWHEVITGITIVDGENIQTRVVKTRVKFRELDVTEIEDYLDSGEYIGKAAAYGIQGQASIFIQAIEGCYFNIVGLPLATLAEMINRIYFPNKTSL